MSKNSQYQVYIDDNFHFMDESQRLRDRHYATASEATARCKQIVDGSLEDCYQQGMSAQQLLTSYKMFGEDPFVIGVPPDKFSAWDYAEIQSRRICS
jgi:hypothetical protein